MKFSSARWIPVTIGLSLLLGVAVILFFAVSDAINEPNSSGSVDKVSGGSMAELQIKPDRTLYGEGDVVQVEGTVVGDADADKSVEVRVVDPEGMLWASDRVKLSSADRRTSSFSVSFRSVRETDLAGVYLVQVRFGEVSANASLLVSTSSGLTAEVRDLKLQNVGGGEVRSSRRIGDVVLVAGSVTNLAKMSRNLTFIVEMRNASGSPVESGYVDTLVPAGGEKMLTVGWPAKAEGVYTVYVYVQDDFQSRYIISNIAEITVRVQN